MNTLVKVTIVILLSFFTTQLMAQLPSFLTGSHQITSETKLDVLVFDGNQVVGKINGKAVVKYSFLKKENDFYYFKKNKSLNATSENTQSRQQEIEVPEDNTRESDNLSLHSSNQISDKSNRPDIKVEIKKLENDETRFTIHYLNNESNVKKKQIMVVD